MPVCMANNGISFQPTAVVIIDVQPAFELYCYK